MEIENRDPDLRLPLPKLSCRQILSPHTSPVNPQACPDYRPKFLAQIVLFTGSKQQSIWSRCIESPGG